MNLDVVRERSGWRDKQLDLLMNFYGCKTIDTFCVSEYTKGKSVAIIEYTPKPKESDDRLLNYCNEKNIYYFIVVPEYSLTDSNECIMENFKVYPKNKKAKSYLKCNEKEFIESEFVKFLYEIRNTMNLYELDKKMFQDILDKPFILDDEISFDFDRIISLRHRAYGYNVPAVDIDAMCCDDNNRVYLFIEYKHNNNRPHNFFVSKNIDFSTRTLCEDAISKHNNQALIDLGNMPERDVPVILVEYNIQDRFFSTYALNGCAKRTVRLCDMNLKEYFKYISKPLVKEEYCPNCKSHHIKQPLILKKGHNGGYYLKCPECGYMKIH